MKCRFLHFSDVHLGYQQYNHKERFNDFGRAFEHIVQRAIAERVDFVLLGGDLFHKRAIDPPTLIQAVTVLGRLKDAGIPVLAVEGNHERAHYRDTFSWIDFLTEQGLLVTLNPDFEDGRPVVKPWNGTQGAYVDLAIKRDGAGGTVRIYGAKYYGASTGQVISGLVEALAGMDHRHLDYVALILHAGLDDVLSNVSATVPQRLLAPLRDYVNYLALGHIHKPYEREDWIFNPGSPETCSVAEAAWPGRGYYLVDVDTALSPAHRAHLVQNPRRPFVRLVLHVDGCASPDQLVARAEAELQAEASRYTGEQRPVVELVLQGVLPFNSNDLDVNRLQDMTQALLSPLIARVTNRTVPTEFEVRSDDSPSLAELERQVIQELIERDARYQAAADEWTRLAVEIKRLVSEGTSPDGIVTHLRTALEDMACRAQAQVHVQSLER